MIRPSKRELRLVAAELYSILASDCPRCGRRCPKYPKHEHACSRRKRKLLAVK